MEQTASEPDNHAGNKDFDVSLVPIGYGAPFDTEIPLQRFDTDASAAFSYFSRTEGKDDSNNMKARVYLTLTHPRSSRSARYAHMFLGCISICSIVLMGVQTMPEFINATVDLRIWNIVQAVLSSILLVEWTVRFFCFPEPRKLDFFKRTLNVTDLIGSLSIVVELGVLFTSSVHSGFEVIGLLRLFRLVRLAEMSGQVRSLTRALSKSRDAFVLMVAVYFIGVWFWASVIYYTERPFCRVDDKTGGLVYIWGNNEGTPCSFQSIIDATWWAVVMMSTVGFGDVVPKTWAGKLVAGFGIIFSVMVLSIPLTIVGSALNEIMSKNAARAREREMRKQLQQLQSGRNVIQFTHTGGAGPRAGILAKATSFLPTFRSRGNNDNIPSITKIFGGAAADPLSPNKTEAAPLQSPNTPAPANRQSSFPVGPPLSQLRGATSRAGGTGDKDLSQSQIQALEQLLNNAAPRFQPGSPPISPLSLPNQQEPAGPRSALTEALRGTNQVAIPANDAASAQVSIGSAPAPAPRTIVQFTSMGDSSLTMTQRDISPGIGYASNADDAITEGESAVEFTIRRLVQHTHLWEQEMRTNSRRILELQEQNVRLQQLINALQDSAIVLMRCAS